jgi:glutaredoxin
MLINNIKKRRQWTEEETETLKVGVEKYGKHWSIIEKIYPIFKKNNRTQTDLKDKWRNIKGRKSPTKDFIDLGENTKEIIYKENIKKPKKSKRVNKSKSKRVNKSKSKRVNKSKSKRVNKSKSKRVNKSKRSKSKKSQIKIDYTIYSIEGCPFCAEAKKLIRKNKLKYKEIKVNDKNKEKIYKKIDSKTDNYRYFPIIFKKNKFIGGFKELSDLLE